MLTASNTIMNEEWVKCWLDKLTPRQKALVTEVLEDCNTHRQPTSAAISIADAIATGCDSTNTLFNSTGSTCPG